MATRRLRSGARVNLGPGVTIDLKTLIATRLLLTANSGAGKSWALRRLLEQTHGHVQQIVLDPEGEFYTLRSMLDYVLAGKGGDCPAEPRSASLLAKHLLELGVSAVIDLSEISLTDRKRFVRIFLETMIDAPRTLWHETLVVLDEAHRFNPEKGHGEAESSEAVAALMSQGRKRGFCGVLSTQRLSKIAKDSAAECNNVLVGRTTLDVDVKRASDLLGLNSREAFDKLRRLKNGEFYGFGPAISDTVTKVMVGKVSTEHPKVGGRVSRKPAPTRTIKAVLKQLRDLPAEAKKEEQTVAALQKTIVELRRELKAVPRVAPAPAFDLKKLKHQIEEASDDIEKAVNRIPKAIHSDIRKVFERLQHSTEKLKEKSKEPFDALAVHKLFHEEKTRTGRFEQPELISEEHAKFLVKRIGDSITHNKSTIGKGEKKVLNVVAQAPNGATRAYVTVMTGFKRSTRDAYLQRLRTAGYIVESADRIFATEPGYGVLGPIEKLPTGDALHDWWYGRLPVGEAQILQRLIEAHPFGMTRDEAGGSFKRSTRDAYVARLAARGLIQMDGVKLKAADYLFES